MFQSSFELTGYITLSLSTLSVLGIGVSKLFRAYGLYNSIKDEVVNMIYKFQSSFELTGYITYLN